MKCFNRRHFLCSLSAAPLAMMVSAQRAMAAECHVQHPVMPPDGQYRGQCPVCGMVRSMWARTWITFDETQGVSQVCSFHCLADWALKSGREPALVKLALYHQPHTSVSSTEAIVVMGSTAAGTMSPVSKIVFADKTEADGFAKNCGGDVIDYATALQAAKASVAKENKTINARRLKKGKIVEPHTNDTCPVCGMHPERYPYGKCQIRTKAGEILHFCSTQCLFAFLGKQRWYVEKPVDPFLIWVVDRNSGMWISGRTAFFVVGSTKVFGPMGFEALPFNSQKEAEECTLSNGGTAFLFNEVAIEKIVPGWKYPQKRP